MADPDDRPLRGVRLVLSVTAARSAAFFAGQIAALRRAGATVFVMTHPSDDVERLCEHEGATLVPVAMARAPSPREDLAALRAAARALRDLRPDVVIAGTPKAGLLVTLAAVAARTQTRIHTLHGLRFESEHGARRQVIWAAQRMSCDAATHVVCVSPSLRARAIATRVVSAKRSIVLGDGSINGIDLARFDPAAAAPAGRALRRALEIGDDALVLGFVGRLARDKGIGVLAGAWERLSDPRVHLLIAGEPDPTDPPPAGAVERLRSAPRVHLLGHREIVPVYAAMDVLVLPTYREGMPTAPLEAAAMAVPTITSRVTGCVDAVEDRRTGTLVTAGDVTPLVDAIRRYVADDEFRRAHGDAARTRVVERFRCERVHALTIDFVRLALEAS